MPVDLELFGQLAGQLPRRQILTLERPMTVAEVASRLGLDTDQVGLVSIDGVQADCDQMVPPDCRLCLFPPMSGG
jgi:hypothetical protein